MIEPVKNITTKEELIAHYACGDIHTFIQIDGWTGDNIADDLVRVDEDNDWLCMSECCELRRSPKELAVRIFIHKGTERKDALRLMEKIRAWIKQRPEMMFNIPGGLVDKPKLYRVSEDTKKEKKE